MSAKMARVSADCCRALRRVRCRPDAAPGHSPTGRLVTRFWIGRAQFDHDAELVHVGKRRRSTFRFAVDGGILGAGHSQCRGNHRANSRRGRQELAVRRRERVHNLHALGGYLEHWQRHNG
jgi:hypothetical protein